MAAFDNLMPYDRVNFLLSNGTEILVSRESANIYKVYEIDGFFAIIIYDKSLNQITEVRRIETDEIAERFGDQIPIPKPDL